MRRKRRNKSLLDRLSAYNDFLFFFFLKSSKIVEFNEIVRKSNESILIRHGRFVYSKVWTLNLNPGHFKSLNEIIALRSHNFLWHLNYCKQMLHSP